MLCQECNENPATVHMTKIINNEKTESHLCQSCARKRNDFDWFAPFSINDLLGGLMDAGKSSIALEKKQVAKCDKCGTDYHEFKQTGRLGCMNCYKVFEGQLTPILKRIQGGSQHMGKIPQRMGAELMIQKEIQTLKQQLQDAISKENFEDAAGFRDRIRQLEQREGQ